MVADGRREDLLAHVVGRYRAVDRRCGAVVVVGSDFDACEVFRAALHVDPGFALPPHHGRLRHDDSGRLARCGQERLHVHAWHQHLTRRHIEEADALHPRVHAW